MNGVSINRAPGAGAIVCQAAAQLMIKLPVRLKGVSGAPVQAAVADGVHPQLPKLARTLPKLQPILGLTRNPIVNCTMASGALAAAVIATDHATWRPRCVTRLCSRDKCGVGIIRW